MAWRKVTPKNAQLADGCGLGRNAGRYGVIVLTWEAFGPKYNLVYQVSGGLKVRIALFCLLAYPQFKTLMKNSTKSPCGDDTGCITAYNSQPEHVGRFFGFCRLYDGRKIWLSGA